MAKFLRRQSQLKYVPRRLKAYLAAMLGHSERQRIVRLKKYLETDEHEFTRIIREFSMVAITRHPTTTPIWPMCPEYSVNREDL